MTAAPSPRIRVRAAQARVEAARLELTGHAVALKSIMQRRRTALIVGSGVVTGLAAGLLPTRFWARIGAFVGGTAAIVARSMLTPMIAGALLARKGVPIDDLSDL